MTPEEKAKELIVNFKQLLPTAGYRTLDLSAKDCAIMCVQEILENVINEDEDYWQSVLNHLKNL